MVEGIQGRSVRKKIASTQKRKTVVKENRARNEMNILPDKKWNSRRGGRGKGCGGRQKLECDGWTGLVD